MTIDNVLEIFEKHKLHIPSNVFYELKADIVNFEEPTTKNDLGVDREDAVERLNAIKQLIGYDKDSEIVKATQKSLDMAIKALEHPEKNVVAVVPCGDCISRIEVLKLIYDYKEKHSENHKEHPINYGTLLDMIRWVRDLPSVTPQEPKWLKSELIKLIDKTYEDFNNAPGGEGWCKIDGKEYYSDMGYAFEGIDMFVDVLKSRMEDT